MKQKNLSDIVGDNIKKFREKKKMSQENLASILGKRAIAVTRMEEGKYKLTVKHIDEVAHALKIPTLKLFDNTKSKRKEK